MWAVTSSAASLICSEAPERRPSEADVGNGRQTLRAGCDLPAHMKGRDRFTPSEADEIRRVLRLVRKAEPGTPQKQLRDQLRAIGFYISDFAGGPGGFTASDFDDLVRGGRIKIDGGPKAIGETVPRPPARPANYR